LLRYLHFLDVLRFVGLLLFYWTADGVLFRYRVCGSVCARTAAWAWRVALLAMQNLNNCFSAQLVCLQWFLCSRALATAAPAGGPAHHLPISSRRLRLPPPLPGSYSPTTMPCIALAPLLLRACALLLTASTAAEACCGDGRRWAVISLRANGSLYAVGGGDGRR